MESEEGETYLFFCLSGNRWDDLVTSDEVYSEYMLCAAEKDAAGIDGVYYYTGDYTGIETLGSRELEQLIGSSIPVSYTHLDVYKRQVRRRASA